MLAANGKITIRQLQILIILSALGTGVIVLPRRVAQFAGQDGWVIVIGLTLLAVLVGALICAAVGAATKAVHKPGAGFIEFTGHLLTRPFAYFCGTVLWVKLVLAAGLELRIFLEITQSIMLPRTPLPVVSFAVLLLCAYAAAKGIETRARVAEILFAVMVLPFLFLVGLAIFDTNFSNLQPVLVAPPQDLLHGTLRLGFIFTGLECLLLVSPFVRKREKMGRHIAYALAFSGAIILIITVLTIAKFGHGVAHQPWPVLRMMDMINIPGSFIERQEALMFSFWIITAFAIGNTMLFFGGVLVKDMFKPRSKHLGVIVTAASAFAVSVFPWQGDVYRVLDYMYTTVGVFFLVVLPLFLLLAAKIRNRQTVVKGATLVALIFLSLSLTACWDRVEIEDRAFVVAIGIDENDGEYEVSLSVPLLKKDGDEESNHHVKTATGQTIAEALKQLDAKTDKTLYYGQAKLLVLGDSLLQDADMTSTVIQTMKHKDEIDLRINVLAAEGSANGILEAKPPGETLPGLFVAEIYRNKNKLGGASFALDLERLASSYHDGAIIPVIQECDCDAAPLKLNGAAVLKNGHIIGNFSTEELQGYLWCMSHGNNSAIVTVEMGEKKFPVKVEKHNTKVEFEPCGESIRAIVNVQVLAKPEEPLAQGVSTHDINRLLSEQIAKEIATTAKLLQSKYAVDGYDWLELLRKKDYNLYFKNFENWSEIFPTVEIVPVVVAELAV